MLCNVVRGLLSELKGEWEEDLVYEAWRCA